MRGISGVDIYRNTFEKNINAAFLIAGPASNIRFHNNTGTNNASFVNAFAGQGLSIYNNTANDTDPSDNGDQGSQIRIEGTDGVLIAGNMLTNAPFDGIAIRGGVNADVLNNHVSGAGDSGIDVTASDAGAAEVRSNESNNNAVNGIHLGSATKENFVSGNNSHNNTGVDCKDDTTGPNRVGVANYWATDNVTASSSPAGLCAPK